MKLFPRETRDGWVLKDSHGFEGRAVTGPMREDLARRLAIVFNAAEELGLPSEALEAGALTLLVEAAIDTVRALEEQPPLAIATPIADMRGALLRLSPRPLPCESRPTLLAGAATSTTSTRD